jgi:hypothetical protein
LEGKDEKDPSRGRSRSRSRDGSHSSRTGTPDGGRIPGGGIRTSSVADGEDNNSRGSGSLSPTRSTSPVGSDGRFRSRSRSVSVDRV